MRGKFLPTMSFLLTSALLAFLAAKSTKAESLIYIDQEGKVRSNVLSVSSLVDIKASESLGKEGQGEGIIITIQDGKTSLSFKSQLLDLSSYSGNLVDDASGEENLLFEKSNGFIYLKKGGFSVRINSSFVYDIVKKKVSLMLSEGIKKEIVTPGEVNKGLSLEVFKNDRQISLDKERGGTYLVYGEKNLGRLNLPFEVKISAESGRIVSIERPSWLSFVNRFLGKG